MQDILFKVARWILSGAQIKFFSFTALFGIVTYFISTLEDYLSPFVGVNALESAFNSLSPSTWYFINMFNMTYGIPIIIGAFITRFLIRRIPVIG